MLTGLLTFGATASAVSAATQITGAGSTFDYPLFSKAFYIYSESHSDVTVNYQSIGSGGGIQQFTAKTVDFGASDVPMDAKELARAKDPVLQIPITLGGEGIAYNLPGIAKGLHLSREVVADIYLGKIGKWDDPAIVTLNPGMKLPSMPITVVHRSDGSGTTYIFTDFLSSVSPAWKQKVGAGKSVSWPASSSVGGKGNEGVAGLVRQTPGAIGYVELAYLLQNDMTYALLQNKAGSYLYPDIATVAAAAATKPDVSSTDFSIVDTSCKDCYPISGYSWALVYKKPSDPHRGALVKQVMEWMATTGQPIAKTIGYVPLPENVQKRAAAILEQMEVK
ncbi:phosphate ABC transporter substrate-binding protein PstS [Acidisphaera rubrifaciens]|uniref:phosphate ABC transporter substrate-binding protein PstS n=1 Tax=Acidisphaera rubrifaciens TaxID=50715 RepID=UPI0018F1EB98|nr:phosphate ABC transporter substrate-binding protein PstS [Acidisphaera rubrifaciens]